MSPKTSARSKPQKPRVALLMGSGSDWDVLQNASLVLTELGIPHESRVISAHRAPDHLFAFAEAAEGRGIQVIIAGAGGAAHLPGVTAAKTTLPVLGVPVPSTSLGGLDALLSIVQMPRGVPVGTMAIGAGGAANAALFAAEILALSDEKIRRRIKAYRERQTARVLKTKV